MEPISAAFLLFPNVTRLDLTAPVRVLSRLGNATIYLVAQSLDPVETDAGFCSPPECHSQERRKERVQKASRRLGFA